MIVLTHIPEARSELATEEERVTAEQSAFISFQRKVSEIEATSTVSKKVGAASMHPKLGDGNIKQVRNAYRETIMSVPHYKMEYDEPIEANMAAELGDEMAAAVLDGGQYTKPIKRRLISQCNDARQRRKELLIVLEREQRRLENAEAELRDIVSDFEDEATGLDSDHTFSELSDMWSRLGEVENRCREFIENHSEAHGNGLHGRPEFREHLYNSVSTTHPVLSEGIRIVDQIIMRRRTALRMLTQTA